MNELARCQSGRPESLDAWDAAQDNLPTTIAKMEKLIADTKREGLTAKEAEQLTGMRINSISPSFTFLKQKGRIFKTERRREGCGVMIAYEHLTPEEKITADEIREMYRRREELKQASKDFN